MAFGGVWKQSLSELSGGQRSLLALSLILALLLFKPAPLYILDEVCFSFIITTTLVPWIFCLYGNKLIGSLIAVVTMHLGLRGKCYSFFVVRLMQLLI